MPRAALRSVAVTRRPSYSGRLLLRMPRTLHEQLAEAAEQEGTSLNQLIVGLLSRSLGSPSPEGAGQRPAARETRTAPGSRGLRVALLANLVAVGLAAAVAVALLILAWRGGF